MSSATGEWEEASQTQEVVRSDLDSQACSNETCNMRGDCVVVEGKRVKCTCTLGYRGDFCEEEASPKVGSIVLGICAVLLVAVAAAGIFIYSRKQRTLRR